MNIISSVIIETNRNGRYFSLSLPTSATYDEALDVVQEMIAAINDMKSKDPRSKPVEEPAAKEEPAVNAELV